MEVPCPLNRNEIFNIYEQMGKCVCLIELKNFQGTGFFCNIPFNKEKQYLPVLVTSNYIINEKVLEENNIISISFFDKKEIRNIECKNRLIYTNHDVTLIEIKPNIDKICNFLEIEENIFKEDKENIFIKKSVYLLHYPQNKSSSVSFGIIKNIQYNKIHYNCWTLNGSGGGPILSMETFKVIGIHKGISIRSQYKIGIFLDNPLNEFQKKV